MWLYKISVRKKDGTPVLEVFAKEDGAARKAQSELATAYPDCGVYVSPPEKYE